MDHGIMIKKVSLKQISQKCGFSVPLVSAVLSGKKSVNRCSKETFEKITNCAKELGYTPNLLAQAVVTGKSPIVLLSLREEHEHIPEVLNFYLNDLLVDGSRRFVEQGLYMLYMPYKTEEEQFEQVKKLANSGIINGVIANIVSSTKHLRLYDYLLETQLPAVILGFPNSDKLVSVGIDNTPIDRYIQDFARKNGYADGWQISQDPFEKRFCCHPGGKPFRIEDFKKQDILFFVAGISCYRHLTEKFPDIDKSRLVLLEDTRFYFNVPHPAILIPSANPQAMELTCNILTPWCRKGKIPEQKQNIIRRSMENVQIIQPV